MEQRFEISSEQVNAYGFRVLTSGIDTTHFERNPIMLYEHQKYDKDSQRVLPIGKWTNLKKEGNKLTGSPLFDDDDEFARKVKSKVEKGMLNAVSMGFDIVEMSSEPDQLLEGQTRPTVTKCVLKEISFVKFPANQNALRLYKNEELVELNDNSLNMIVPLLDNKKQPQPMNQIALELGLEADATEEAILKALREQRADLLMELARERAILSKENETSYKELATANFKATKELILSAKRPTKQKESLAKVIKEASLSSPEGNENWTFKDWEKKDPKGLKEMKLNDPKKYQDLAQNYGK